MKKLFTSLAVLFCVNSYAYTIECTGKDALNEYQFIHAWKGSLKTQFDDTWFFTINNHSKASHYALDCCESSTEIECAFPQNEYHIYSDNKSSFVELYKFEKLVTILTCSAVQK